MEPEDCTQFLNDVPAPHDIATVHERVAQFVKIATCKGRPLALVTVRHSPLDGGSVLIHLSYSYILVELHSLAELQYR